MATKPQPNIFYKGADSATVGDLLSAIVADKGVSEPEQHQLIQQIMVQVNHAPVDTPLSSLMGGGLGGIVGMLISRYFGMGVLGRTVSAVGGFGLASSLLGRHTPPNPHPGWIEL